MNKKNNNKKLVGKAYNNVRGYVDGYFTEFLGEDIWSGLSSEVKAEIEGSVSFYAKELVFELSIRDRKDLELTSFERAEVREFVVEYLIGDGVLEDTNTEFSLETMCSVGDMRTLVIKS